MSKEDDTPKFGWRMGVEGIKKAVEEDDMRQRFDAIARVAGMDMDDPRRLIAAREYLSWCDDIEEPVDGGIIAILVGMDLMQEWADREDRG